MKLYNAIIRATGEHLQVYMAPDKGIYMSPKYPGRGFNPDELEIVGEA